MTTLQASLHVADWPVATSPRDARRPASTSTFLPMPGATLPRTLASPRTGLAPAGYPELGTRLHPISLHSLGDTFADARAAGRTLVLQPSALLTRTRTKACRAGRSLASTPLIPPTTSLPRGGEQLVAQDGAGSRPRLPGVRPAVPRLLPRQGGLSPSAAALLGPHAVGPVERRSRPRGGLPAAEEWFSAA
jgi:hypothetical protein